MKLLENNDWPEELKEELRRQLDELPLDSVDELVGHFPSLCPGFRKTEAAAGLARRKMFVSLLSSDAISEKLTLALSRHLFCQRFTFVLSTKALSDGFSELCLFFGTARIVLSMLFDSRANVRKKALDYLDLLPELPENRRWFPPVDPAADSAGFRKLQNGLFQPFLSEVGRIAKTPVLKKSAEPDVRISKLEEDLRKAREDVSSALQSAKSEKENRKALEQDLRVRDRRIRELEEQIASHVGAGAEADAALQAADARAEDAKNIASDLREKLRLAEASLRSVAGERDRAVAETADFRKRFLEKSAEADRLREAVAANSDADQELQRLRSEKSSWEAERAELLSETAWIDKPVERRVAPVRASVEELERRLKLLEEAVWTIEKRSGSIAAASEEVSDGPRTSAASAPVPGPRPETRSLLGDLIGGTVQKRQHIQLMVDGHNVLNLHEKFVLKKEFGQSHEDARNELADDLLAVLPEFGDCDVRLYFDGDYMTTLQVGDRLRVIYSGGVGEHRADNAIVDDLMLARATGTFCVVVTQDNGLADRVRAEGGWVARSEAFINAFLKG